MIDGAARANYETLVRQLVEHQDLGLRAPILEALLQMRFSSLGVAVESFREFGTQFGGFPKAEEQLELRVREREDDNPGPTFEHELIGLVFAEENARRVIHIRRDSFVVLARTPYPGWESLLDFARSAWARFLTTASPPMVTQIALRYINRLPSDPRLAQFRATGPETLGEQRTHFQQVSYQHPDDPNCIGRVMYGTAPKDESNMMFDISVRATGELEPTSDSLWERFRDLRTFKNDIFFSYLPVPTWT